VGGAWLQTRFRSQSAPLIHHMRVATPRLVRFQRTLKALLPAALIYLALVLGTGFLLGVVRVPFLVPRMGERWAELAEMPIMAATIYFAAGHILRRFPDVRTPARSLVAGILAFVLAVVAELGLAMVLQNQSLQAFIASRDKVSGAAFVALLLAFAAMPRLLLSASDSAVRDKLGV